MYFSKELNEATQKLISAARRNSKILGMFQFGTARVREFLDKGFTFISIGNDLHHMLTQANAHVDTLEEIGKGSWRRKQSGIAGESKVTAVKSSAGNATNAALGDVERALELASQRLQES
eukprot:gene1073-48433_t